MFPQRVITGDSLAATTIGEKACKCAGLNSDIVERDRQLRSPDVDQVVCKLRQFDETVGCGLIVLPRDSAVKLLQWMCRTAPANLSQDASLVMTRLQVSGNWPDIRAGECGLPESIEGRSLPTEFPFPDLSGDESRPRPAYYYRQSAVVPFRGVGDMKILVVSTRKRKRWGIPKGIHDPGKSAQESAANEAFEEAGLLGTVLDDRLGVYRYAKWGGTCEVTVFPMHVTRELPDSEWQENDRLREWMTPADAVARVDNDDVSKMIDQLSRLDLRVS